MERKVLGKRPRDRDDYLTIEDERDYRFKVLLPNGTSVSLKLRRSNEDEMTLQDFIEEVRIEYNRTVGATVVKERRKIVWRDRSIHLEDTSGNKITKTIPFRCFKPDNIHTLLLHDGVRDASGTFEIIWDLTPDTEILLELPQEYTSETALADLIDNSLQAVWSNGCDEMRLVSVTIDDHGITIFDTGPGMDGNDKNSLAKWGKMGASLHRSARHLAIGGKPPYLTPYFGMFGYGGPIASMHLGRKALVSSKTKDSEKVYFLYLEREALIKSAEKDWKTNGGIRDPFKDEIKSSPHGSFTKVEISGLIAKFSDINRVKCRLKDIYFPYIQCDEMLGTGRTATPVQFQVNGEDLAELEGGEVAITNMLSCNGPEFILQLQFLINQDTSVIGSTSSKISEKAHARLKCVYFPIVQGKETIDVILEKLKEGYRVADTFDTFPRTSIRRLGRLLPDARWGRLPFMEPKQRRGDKAQVLKRCCARVKCFIDTDAGFNPNPYKTDLAIHHPYTDALRNFGNKPLDKEFDLHVEIFRDGKPLSLFQFEKEYEAWVLQMHEENDEEIVRGEDPGVLILNPQNKKGLGISSDVVRVHEVVKRKGETWKSGQQIKILKGAPGCYKNNLYATLEYILLEGLEGDVCGEVRIVCRPLDVPEDMGCLLKVDNMNNSLDIRCSISFPISIIDSGKCKLMDSVEVERQLNKLHMKAPSSIDVLNAQECKQLGIGGELSFDAPLYAEDVIYKHFVAVLRPVSYNPSSSSQSLDQKFIIKDELEMSMEITYLGEDDGLEEEKHFFSERTKPSTRSGIQGLYIFSMGSRDMKFGNMDSGIYKFLFTVNCEGSSPKKCEKRLTILPDTKGGQWRLISDKKSSICHIRVGSYLPCISVACIDAFGDRVPFMSIPEVMVKIEVKKKVLGCIRQKKVSLSSDKSVLNISEILIESSNLDSIRPHYMANLGIYSQDELHTVSLPCNVTPGPLCKVKVVCFEEERLLPCSVIKSLVLEIFDKFGNHVERGVEVSFDVDGLYFQDHKGSTREVDGNGYIDLSGVLMVNTGYGKIVSLSVNNGTGKCFKKEFLVEKRMLRVVSPVPENCPVGSELEDITFEVVDSEGAIDETIHDDMKFGRSHTLKITSEFQGLNDPLQYSFIRGRCTVPSFTIPQEEGIYSMLAAHSNHPELCTNLQLRAVLPPQLQMESLHTREDDVSSQCSIRGRLLDRALICLSRDEENLLQSIRNSVQEFDDDVERVAMRVGEHEKKLDLLNEKKKSIEQEIYDLQALVEPQALTPLDYFINEKEGIMRKIEGKGNTAASVIYKLLKVNEFEGLRIPWLEGIIGIVALLGTVSNTSLSRIFAEYLGEDNMLAVICKSYAAASDLEKYEEHGIVDRHSALHYLARELGVHINGRFLVIGLEEISPYTGRIQRGDPQRKLDLPNPLLPTGYTPPGFLGYAVNMINLDADCLFKRTTKGFGLRETLFYLLFGKLQVYETRECMKKAMTCIKDGAVSLDGGILKGNGTLSLGDWEPEICFPVDSSEVQKQLSPQTVNILREVADKKSELEATIGDIEKEYKVHSEVRREFQEKKEQYQNFLSTQEPVLNELRAHASQNVNVKTESVELG